MTDNEIIKALSDLINRQKAEIEQWKEEADRWQNAFCKANEDMSTIKFEAIKEFAERLKEIIYTHMDRVDVDGVVLLTRVDNSIDNLVKEITEEKDES